MATSNSIDLSMTARDIITAALKKLAIIGPGQTGDADDVSDARGELNRMLKGWMQHKSLWRMTEGSATLVADTGSYTLSPDPYRVISARYRDANSIDTPMARLSRDEYYDLPQKTANGVPTQFYVDRQRASSVLYVWPVKLTVSGETVQYTYQRKFDDVDTLDEEVDIRQEWFDLVVHNLAARLADSHGMSGARVDRVIARAGQMLAEALDDDREEYVRFYAGAD